MMKYKLSIYYIKQIGLCVGYDEEFIILNLPFITIKYGRGKEAKGLNFNHKILIKIIIIYILSLIIHYIASIFIFYSKTELFVYSMFTTIFTLIIHRYEYEKNR